MKPLPAGARRPPGVFYLAAPPPPLAGRDRDRLPSCACTAAVNAAAMRRRLRDWLLNRPLSSGSPLPPGHRST
eukprot:1217224-Prymnesium_polylepis.1